MTNHDFKSAAAKLLAQHSSNAEKIVPKSLVTQKEQAVSPPVTLALQKTAPEPERPWKQPEVNQERIVLPVWDSYEESGEKEPVVTVKEKFPRNSMKVLILFGLIVFFSVIMVFLLPPTKIGIIGNIALGVLAGGGFGFIINREL